MAKKSKKHELSDMLRSLEDHVKTGVTTRKIPSIIEFVENKEWLGMRYYANPITPYPTQRLLLKTFYRGSIGNEDLELDEQDLEIIESCGLNNEENGDVVSKWKSNVEFRELVLVWGRRSGKGFLVSIIALYECMKLLEVTGGNPYSMYKLASAAPFTILTVANSSKQAQYVFKEIKDKVLQSTYFKERLDEDHIHSDTLTFLTPHDRERNADLIKRGLPSQPGSVVVHAGHSNSESLVGLSCYCLLLDEIGLYKNTAGASSGDAIYNSLAPAVKTYIRDVEVKDSQGNIIVDEKGKPKLDQVFDGKVICISSPRGKEGIFFDLYSHAHDVSHRLMMRCPTWNVNPRYSETMLQEEFPNMPEAKFRMEFGAEFSGTGGESFFPRDAVEQCFRNNNLREIQFGIPGIVYFAHLDPAISSHNYALVVCHRETFFNSESNQRDFRIAVDHVKCWSPSPDKNISVEEVDNYVSALGKRFHLGLVTYDQWNCVHPDTFISTTLGLKRAKDLLSGDTVYNREGGTNSVINTGSSKNVNGYKIKTKFGYSVQITKNHPLFVKEQGFTEANHLNVGDIIEIQDFNNNFGFDDFREEAVLAGYLVSEGYVDKKNGITFTNTDKELIDEYIDVSEKIFCKSASVRSGKNIDQNPNWKEAWDVRYRSSDSIGILESMGIGCSRSHNKVTPNFIFTSNKYTCASYLSALFEGDGTICSNVNNICIQLDSASKKLIEETQILLLAFGIKSSRKTFRREVSGEIKEYHRVSIYGENIIDFGRDIGFRSSTKKQKLLKTIELQKSDKRGKYNKKSKGIRKSHNKKSRSRYMCDRIISIEPIVIDITHIEVDGDHTYISNGLVSHNSNQSIMKMRKAGLPAIETRFNRNYKMLIYDNLHDLVISGRLLIPNNKSNHILLRNEMLNLQRKWSPNGGYRVLPKNDGDITTDDACDALAGACFNCMDKSLRKLPQGKLANMPVSPLGGQHTFRQPQGNIPTAFEQGLSPGMQSLIDRTRGHFR